jgi:hypothetical protein
METIAERALTCIRSNGERISITLSIGKPVPDNDGDWKCSAQAIGLFTDLTPIHGVDSFQALMLAQALLRHLIRQEMNNGSTFLAFDPEVPVSFEDIFEKNI